MWILRLIILLPVIAGGAALASLNAEQVRFDYYFGAIDVPLSFLLVGSLGAGVLLGVLASLTLALGARRESARLRRKARLTEQEIVTLRTLPLQDR